MMKKRKEKLERRVLEGESVCESERARERERESTRLRVRAESERARQGLRLRGVTSTCFAGSRVR